MATFPYNSDIPNSPNNPSVDQPKMKTNTNSIDDLLNVDHYSFEQSNLDGFHKQVHMISQAAPGLAGADSVLYSGLFASNSWPGWQNALGTQILTTTMPSSTLNGIAGLPGGTIFQWGQVLVPGVSGTVLFSIAPNIVFTNLFNIQLTLVIPSPATIVTAVVDTGGPTQFTYRISGAGAGAGTSLFWTALGN